jgi:hypothetical protein
MANSLLTINMITREAVRLWKNTNAFMLSVDTQYDDSFARSGAKIGSTLRIRLPNDYTVRTGPAASVQDTAEQSTTLTLATQKGVDVSFSSADRTLSLDDYSKRILAPMVNNLAGTVATDIISGADGGICNITANQNTANEIINPNAQTYLLAKAILANNSAPNMKLKAINNPITEARMVASLAGLLNPATAISKQYEGGEMYKALGMIWFSDQTVTTHTNGALAQNSATINGADQTGNTITVNALAAGLALGDIITIAGVNAVNRITKQSTGELRQFAVTAAAAAGATSISIYPALTPAVGGNAVQYQTVDASPADGAAVNPALTLAASTQYRKNFVFAPEAVTMATADLEIPRGVHEAAREQFDGISMRMVTAYNVGTDQFITRLDILYGYLWVRPEWACIVADAV